VTRFITYDEWNPIYEWEASGNALAANFYGTKADEIIGRWDSSWGFLSYKQDKQGNVVTVLDQGGAIVEKYRYDAFGQPTISDWNGNGRTSSAIGNRFMYTGREYIQELSIYDYRHRMYHPGLGRFLQTDPTGFDAGDMNLFRYCADDPVDHSDPMGLDWGFLPDQFPRNFDNIADVPTKEANGYTARPVFFAVASIVPSGEGYAIRYQDVNIRSQSYIRTHQRRLVTIRFALTIISGHWKTIHCERTMRKNMGTPKAE
jgi:RHS repeat-associated protein